MKKNNTSRMRLSFLATLALVFSTAAAHAEVAVIVNPANANAITPEQIAQLYWGKTKRFDDGSIATAINQKTGNAATDSFNQAILKKSGSQIKAYWAEIIFTGKGAALKEMGSDAEVKAAVAKDKTAIGYIDAAMVDASVKTVFKIP